MPQTFRSHAFRPSSQRYTLVAPTRECASSASAASGFPCAKRSAVMHLESKSRPSSLERADGAHPRPGIINISRIKRFYAPSFPESCIWKAIPLQFTRVCADGAHPAPRIISIRRGAPNFPHNHSPGTTNHQHQPHQGFVASTLNLHSGCLFARCPHLSGPCIHEPPKIVSLVPATLPP